MGPLYLVIGTDLSIAATAQLALVSKQTVKTMRKVRDSLAEKTSEGFLGQLDWAAARARYDGMEAEFDTNDGWLDKKARRIAEKLTKTFGTELSQHPRALWLALDIYDTNLVYAFCAQHGINTEFLEDNTPNEAEADF